MAETATPLGLLLSDDLMFSSRITGTARDLGLACKVARNPAALEALAREHGPACIILDLGNPGLVVPEVIRTLKTAASRAFLVAYGSHVDTAMLAAARAAGCDVVLPRSRFVEELPRQLPAWFSGKHQPQMNTDEHG
jgi:DNA-binding NarL/FixJ family response regulator